MDTQEIFDTVANHLWTQGRPAKNREGNCLYRTSGGLKCAIGCLIPDEMYTVNMEGLPVLGLLVNEQFILPSFFYRESRQGLLEDLQTVHDHCFLEADGTFKTDDLDTRLVRVALTHGLIYTKRKQ